MNEFDDINLPADFDDLSKHAPLLEKIRAKGEGFVVPEEYFGESATLTVISNCRLSVVCKENSGLTVPENYFEKLAENIIAIAGLSSAYNGQLTTDNRKLTIEPFKIPDDYFEEMDETIRTKLSLDNLKQDEGFAVPSAYFESFSNKIITHVAVDELGKGSDAEVPPGYFDTLADKISACIAEEEGTIPTKEHGKIIVFAEIMKRYARPVSVAASVALLVAVSIWFFNRGEEKIEMAKINPPQQNIQPVIPLPTKDSVVVIKTQENIVVQPKIKKHKQLNQQQQEIVKEVSSGDVLEQLDLLDENIVADFVANQNPEIVSPTQDQTLNEEMLNYLLENGTDPSDINK
ncbi:MAG: hypothetical protein ABIQ40_14135 [Bacteroidia bacterium]